jgi:F0F1-type ATP synthase assembly protein I
MANIWELYQRQKDELTAHADSLAFNLQQKHDAALNTIKEKQESAQQQVNQQSRLLAEQLVGAGDALLTNQLQPIIINPKKESPWGLVVVGAILTYILFRP